MNAETRAKELMAAIVERGTGGWRFAAEVEEALPLITAAITRAENDKLEEAAQAASGAARASYFYVSQNRDDPFNQGVRAAEQAVLALKSKD